MDQREQQRERDKIIRQLQVLETQIAMMGWDTYTKDLAEVRRDLAARWEQVRKFDEAHPRGPDGAFAPRSMTRSDVGLCRTCGHPERYHGRTIKLPDGSLRRLAPARLLARVRSERGMGGAPDVCPTFEQSYPVEGVL